MQCSFNSVLPKGVRQTSVLADGFCFLKQSIEPLCTTVLLRGIVTEIPLVDEDTKWELFSLLGDWYEPESIESLFSSMPSDAVFFSS